MKKKKRVVYKNWLSSEGLLLLRCWARDGLSYAEIAEKVGITQDNLFYWRCKYPEIRQALDITREQVDYEVENALFRRCIGGKTREVKTITGYAKKDGSRPVRTEETESYFLPDVTACLAWLNNRCPDRWKRNRDNFASAEEEAKNQKVTINIIADKKAAEVQTSEGSAEYMIGEAEQVE